MFGPLGILFKTCKTFPVLPATIKFIIGKRLVQFFSIHFLPCVSLGRFIFHTHSFITFQIVCFNYMKLLNFLNEFVLLGNQTNEIHFMKLTFTKVHLISIFKIAKFTFIALVTCSVAQSNTFFHSSFCTF